MRPGIAPVRALLTALSLFTVLPVTPSTHRSLEPAEAARAVRWLPVVGALVGVMAALVLVVVREATPGAGGRLLAAVLALALLAVVTGGMHLDGLADTIDGLASHRSAEGTLEVMDRSDVGPLGVAALLFTVTVQVAALAAIEDTALAAAALLAAAVTGRTAVLTATGRRALPARPGGFGALVTGSTTRAHQVVLVGATVCAIAAAAAGLGGPVTSVQFVGATLLGLLVAHGVRRTAARRVSGVTGDVFGALVETATATVLVTLALTS